MTTYIRTIGCCQSNGISFDIYEKEDGTATIKPCSWGSNLPSQYWKNFTSLEDLEEYVERINTNDLSGFALVQHLKETVFSYIY